MKKRNVIILTIFIIIILAITVMAIYQRNNISAVITSVSKTEEEIAKNWITAKNSLRQN